MTAVFQARRGNAAEHTTFTGAVAEITVDTTDKRAVVHDGTTAGGIPLAKESELPGSNPQFTTIELGHASDTTLARSAAGAVTIEGNRVLAIADPNADRILIWDDSASNYVAATFTSNIVISGTAIRGMETHGIAASDETTAITTGTNKATFSLPYAFTITSVYATLNTVSSSGAVTVDINEAGTTILSTKLTIDQSEKTSGTAATAAVISDASIAAYAEIGIDIDGAGTGAKGLKVFIVGYPT